MAVDKLAIVNGALSKIGEPPIRSLDGNGTAERAVKQRFDDILEQVLRRHIWSCAKTRKVLTPLADPPEFGYSYQFQLPPDFLRLVMLNREDYLDDYVFEGRRILANTNVIYLEYVKLITDFSEVDAAFREALEYRLAAEICVQVTNNSDKQRELNNGWKDCLNKAKLINAQELPVMEPEIDEWLEARNSFSQGRFRNYR